MRGVDQRPAQYGYLPPDARQQDGAGPYSLKDRPVSAVLRDKVIRPLSSLMPGEIVIDLGSGDGFFPKNAGGNRPYDIVAVDLEPGAVRSVHKIFGAQRRGRRGQDNLDVAVVGNIARLNEVSALSGKVEVGGAVSWRVLHGIPEPLHEPTFAQVYDKLKPGASFYIAVASDQDWKVAALGEGYLPEQTNNCTPVMFHEHGVAREHEFPILFFTEDRLRNLAQGAGFGVKEMGLFEEPSGYPHLKDGMPNTYLFAELVKPLNRRDMVVPSQVVADATVLVDFATRSKDSTPSPYL